MDVKTTFLNGVFFSLKKFIILFIQKEPKLHSQVQDALPQSMGKRVEKKKPERAQKDYKVTNKIYNDNNW
jgi:hypothetical protein